MTCVTTIDLRDKKKVDALLKKWNEVHKKYRKKEAEGK